jgi:hypothetical protein
MGVNSNPYDFWFTQVREALDSINMLIEDWQTKWTFDFQREFAAGVPPADAALKANKFWWNQ